MSAQIKLTPQSYEDLRYDQDGDGTFETAVVPTVNVSGGPAHDREPPTITASRSNVQTQVQVTLDAQDAASGVSSLRYSLDGTTFQEYTTPLMVDPVQTPVVYAFADDNVGNRSAPFELRLTNGLVAAYSFDAGSGTTVYDASGTGNHGTFTDATWTSAGKYGGALTIANEPVVVPDSDSLDLASGMTLEAWVSTSGSTDLTIPLIRKLEFNPLNPAAPYSVYRVTIDSDLWEGPTAGIWTMPGDGGGSVYCDPAWHSCYPVGADGWLHVAATYDGADVLLYLNGTLVARSPVTGTLRASAEPLEIDNAVGERIDEVRIYNRVLSQSEIQADMQTPIGANLLPGHIEAEDYRAGGEGVGYHDTTAGNTGGAYRADDVDIQTCTDGSGCYNVGWTAAGEWLAYDLTVTTAGTYVWQARVASPHSGKTLHLEIDGQPSGGTLSVPNTGSYQTWTTIQSAPVTLAAGAHTLRIVFETGSMNLNDLDLVAPSTRLHTARLSTSA